MDERIKKYLGCSDQIDCEHPLVVQKAAELSKACHSDEIAIAKSCFEFVRDSINHSWDYRRDPVTCKASEVLIHGTGYCYSKSHLLAALLRANMIPAGLCYQRLSIENGGPPFSLHGLEHWDFREGEEDTERKNTKIISMIFPAKNHNNQSPLGKLYPMIINCVESILFKFLGTMFGVSKAIPPQGLFCCRI